MRQWKERFIRRHLFDPICSSHILVDIDSSAALSKGIPAKDGQLHPEPDDPGTTNFGTRSRGVGESQVSVRSRFSLLNRLPETGR
jgi:hypothetical protein